MNTSTSTALAAKLDKAQYWLDAVKEGIDAGDLTNSDLVCLQCELEEAVTLIEAQRKDKRAKSGQVNAVTVEQPAPITLDEYINEQAQERGLEPMPLETDILLKRVKDGGHSGQFLADAFISAYRTHQPFNHSLGELTRLDAEGFRLFHEILHIRHVPGWRDDALYGIEQQIKAIQTEVARNNHWNEGKA